LLVLAAERPARALPLCDEDGRFCIALDVASARVCDTGKLGRLDPATCDPDDELLRTVARELQKASAGILRSIASVVVRFEDMRVNVSITRHESAQELTDDASLSTFAQGVQRGMNAAMRSSGWLVEPAGPPSMLRVHDVEVARMQWHGVSANVTGAVHFVEITYDVWAEDAGYLVTFATAGSDVSRLAPFADASMATLEAHPRGAVRRGEAITWIVRGLVAAVALAAVAIVAQRRSRRRRSPIEPRDLWPMR
jgi:hypothetical protein